MKSLLASIREHDEAISKAVQQIVEANQAQAAAANRGG
jgi:hypothetical protein